MNISSDNHISQLLSEDNFFTAESEHGFMQARKNPTGGFILEYQDLKVNHYCARQKNLTLQEIKKTLDQYLENSEDGQWKIDIEWILDPACSYDASTEHLSWIKKINVFIKRCIG